MTKSIICEAIHNFESLSLLIVVTCLDLTPLFRASNDVLLEKLRALFN